MNRIELKGGYWIKAETIGYSLNQDTKPKRGFKGEKLDECVHDEVGKTEIDNIMYPRGIILAAKEEIKTKLKDR